MNSSTNLSDLWALTAQDDQIAFESLHKSMYPGLYGYLLRMVEEEEVVDDLLQELFIKVWNKRKETGPINNVKAYFFTAARSMAINHFRKKKSDSLKLDKFSQPEITFSSEDIVMAGECDNELKKNINLALNMLPARQREIIYLRFYEEMDYHKIAELTGIRYQSVVNHVFRALQTLRAEFSGPNSIQVFA